MNQDDAHLVSLVQSASRIQSAEQREKFLDESCGKRPGLRTRMQAIIDIMPEEAKGDPPPAPHRTSEQSVLEVLADSVQAPSVVLDDSIEGESEPIVQPTSIEIPKTIESSRFQLQGEIARGGMGAILKGRDVDLGRNLAIKVLLDQHKDKPQVIQRFIEEAQIGGQLQHPGVAPVYEMGQFEDGRPFFTMKLVRGDTLAFMLAVRKSLDHDRSKLLGIFEQVCQTMAYAHSRGVIHRDLKPANVMVGSFGEVQVMDWGLAKVLPEPGQPVRRQPKLDATDGKSVIATLRSGGSDAPVPLGTAGSSPSETQLGSALGTPAYMPPEQGLGEVERMDRRSDVFGLGAILCEILTGKPPYVADDLPALMRLVARGNTDECFQRLDQCGADPELVELAKNCLAFDLGDRPADAGEVADRVKAYLESVENQIKEAEIRRAEEEARTVEERKRLRVILALATMVLLMLAIGGGGWMWNQQQNAQRRRFATQEFDAIINQAKLHQRRAENSDLKNRQTELELAIQNAQSAVTLTSNRDLSKQRASAAQELQTQLEANLKSAQLAWQRQQRDKSLRDQLELIRASDGGTNHFAAEATGHGDLSDVINDGYKEVFQQAGIDFDSLVDSSLQDAIAGSSICETLVCSLDHWAAATPRQAGDDRDRLLRIAQSADPNPWRKQIRTAIQDVDGEADEQPWESLFQNGTAQNQPPEIIASAAAMLRRASKIELAIELLTNSLLRHPADFWLNYEQARCHQAKMKNAEAIHYARAAFAVAPQSSAGKWLRNAYLSPDKTQGAVAR